MRNIAPHLQDVSVLAALLPPFPRVVIKALDLLRDDKTNIDDLAGLIRNDPVLTGNVISTANHMRRAHARSDLTDTFAAASLIGVDRLRRIVVTAGMNRFVLGADTDDYFYKHAIAVAICAQEIAAMCGENSDEAYIAGILHDIGEHCLCVIDAEAFMIAHEKSHFDGNQMGWESQIFGVNHCQIGEQLAYCWNLPAHIADAIGAHHDQEPPRGELQAIVCLAETLAMSLNIPASNRNRVAKINGEAVAMLGIEWGSPESIDCFGRCVARFSHAVLPVTTCD